MRLDKAKPNRIPLDSFWRWCYAQCYRDWDVVHDDGLPPDEYVDSEGGYWIAGSPGGHEGSDDLCKDEREAPQQAGEGTGQAGPG